MDQTLRILLALILMPALALGQSVLPQLFQPDPSTQLKIYTDSFTRANGGLGANWTTPLANACALTIVSDQAWAATTPPCLHNGEGYTAGVFSNNQWTQITISNNGGSNALQADYVRINGSNFYNDAVGPGVTSYQLGNQASTDFCGVAPTWGTVSVGDTFRLNVADTGVLNAPEFFWLEWTHSGVTQLAATCVDTTYHNLNGVPGLGTVETGSTPGAALGMWMGGSLPAITGSSYSDNFTRPDSDWLGVNWWFAETGGSGTGMTAQMKLASHAVSLNLSLGYGVAVWTTPYTSQTQSCTITAGVVQSGDWIGCVVRYSMPTMGIGNASSNSFYLTFVQGNGTTTLYEYQNGNFNTLASLGTCGGGSITSTKLTASGSNPVVLTVYVDGSACGSAYSDSTYKLSGTYGGFFLNGSNSTTVTSWSGN